MDLFKTCFMGSGLYTIPYLKWLYSQNPAGNAIGFDAFDGKNIAAHYACIPVHINLYGNIVKALLSLNTATHPNYRKQGLFIKLAEYTYEYAEWCGFESVHGFANFNSTHGFVHKLGFELVSPLNANIGFGRIGKVDWEKLDRVAVFQRHWNKESLQWRLSNPSNPCFIQSYRDQTTGVYSRTGRYGINAYAEHKFGFQAETTKQISLLTPRLCIGLYPKNLHHCLKSFPIPQILRPSPLNFIYRNLKSRVERLDSEALFITYIDFDAF